MNELIAELQRLYFPQCATTTLAAALAAEGEAAMDPVAADGRVTALVISLDCSLWAQAAHLCEQVQDELGLPAPAVSVSGGSHGGRGTHVGAGNVTGSSTGCTVGIGPLHSGRCSARRRCSASSAFRCVSSGS